MLSGFYARIRSKLGRLSLTDLCRADLPPSPCTTQSMYFLPIVCQTAVSVWRFHSCCASLTPHLNIFVWGLLVAMYRTHILNCSQLQAVINVGFNPSWTTSCGWESHRRVVKANKLEQWKSSEEERLFEPPSVRMEVYYERHWSKVFGLVTFELRVRPKTPTCLRLNPRFLICMWWFRTHVPSSTVRWRVCMHTRWVDIILNSFVSTFVTLSPSFVGLRIQCCQWAYTKCTFSESRVSLGKIRHFER